MKITYCNESKILKLELTEEIDHHNSEKIKNRMDYEIQTNMPKKVILDLKNVNFMDSAGIGLIIGRYKVANLFGAKVSIANISLGIKKVLEISGIFTIIQIENVEIGGDKVGKCV